MGSRTDIARQFNEAQMSRDAEKIEAVGALIADSIVMSNPRTGEISGRDAVIDRLKNPPQMGGGGGGGGMGQLVWSEPVEDGATVKMTVTTPMGTMARVFSFDDTDKITRIEVARG